jgi:purine-binding chemotaxis protein CheW
MDISKIRKKHKQAKERPESKEPEEIGEPEQHPEEDEFAEEPVAAEEPEASEEPEAPEDPVAPEELEAPEETEVGISERESADAVEVEKSLEPETAKPEPTEAVEEALEEEESVAEELAELVTFILADEYYAFRVTGIHEVLRPQYIARVPRAVDFIVGVTSLRGTIIPVMDLRKRLHIEGENHRASNIVILKGVGRGIIGVLVDRTVDVIKIRESDILQPPSHLADSEARFIEGVTSQKDKFISIIDPEELLSFNAMGEEHEK